MSRVTGALAALLIVIIWSNDSLAARCSLSITSISFGTYDVLSASPTDSTGGISVYCKSATFVTATIGPSINSGGFDPRQTKLTTGTELMNYNLFRDVSRSQIWGDGTGSTFTVSGTVPKKTTTILDKPLFTRFSAQYVSP